jgi:nucleoside-diphosphate-sugar epimerase
MRILVTGAGGFIGLHLVKDLRCRGDRVTCLVRPTSKHAELAKLDVDFGEADVTDPSSLEQVFAACQPQIVYHLAGLTRALSNAALLKVNAAGSANVARCCAELAVPPKLVLVSSLAAAGPAVGMRIPTEADIPAPVSCYGRSKLAGEQAARRFAQDVAISIVRPPVIFGPGDTDVLQLFRLVSRRGMFLLPGSGNGRLAMLHVADLVTALLTVAERGERIELDHCGGQGCYYLAAESSPTLADFAQMLATAVGRPGVRTIHIPPTMARLLGLTADMLGWLRQRPARLSRDKMREALAGSWLCATDKARTQLDFVVAAPLPHRLHDTANWYRLQGLL